MKNDTLYWVWLAQHLGAGNKHTLGLIDRFGSVFDIYLAEPEMLVGVGKRESVKYQALADKNLDEAMNICRSCDRLGVEIISIADERYPKRLRAIQDPPTVLYCRGKIPNFDKLLCIGIVGTRKMSEYGCRSAYKISYGLASSGVVTVSGMASGVDSVVACASFAANGHTVAVLGSGIDVVYPASNKRIYAKLLEDGTVISEYPPGFRPTKYSFPLRNRIISGLSQGVFVVEGDFNSGAMITAKDALVQGRELFALPGNVGEANSNGTNEMIREGAHPVVTTEDILNEFLPLYKDVTRPDRIRTQRGTPEYDASVLAKYGVVPEFLATKKTPEVKDPGRSAWQGPAYPSFDGEKKANSENKIAADRKVPVEPKKDDGSQKAYKMLDPKLRAVYDRLPSDGAATVDRLAVDGLNIGDVIAALTLLELRGLVVSLPGGLYART